MARSARILAVATSTERYEKVGYRTGLWLGELTEFYDVASEAGHRVDIVSVEGGRVPLDPASVAPGVINVGNADERYKDPAFMALLDNTPSVTEVLAGGYDAIFLAGGHGTMFDFTARGVTDLVSDFAAHGKIVSAVCHGPAGLINAKAADGSPLIKGRKVTGFTWREEKLAGRREAVPFRLHEALKEAGGKYRTSRLPMTKHVVVDGNLITGQNPMSAAGVGKAVVKALKKN